MTLMPVWSAVQKSDWQLVFDKVKKGELEAVSSISSTVYMCHRHGVFHAGFFYCSRKKISGLAERGNHQLEWDSSPF